MLNSPHRQLLDVWGEEDACLALYDKLKNENSVILFYGTICLGIINRVQHYGLMNDVMKPILGAVKTDV